MHNLSKRYALFTSDALYKLSKIQQIDEIHIYIRIECVKATATATSPKLLLNSLARLAYDFYVMTGNRVKSFSLNIALNRRA